MKKFLLFVAVAMVAMTANAQKADRSMSFSQKANATLLQDGSMSVALKANAKKFGLLKTGNETIELISAEMDEAGDETEMVAASSVEIIPTGKKVTYKEVEWNEAKTPLGNLDGCEWTILFNDDKTSFCIPVNQEYTDPEYGLIYMWGIIEKEDGIYYDDENDIVFNLNAETGMYDCERVGWAMKMTGEYEQYVWTSSWYANWMIPNGVENGSLGKGGWSEYSNPIFVEDLTDEVNIYNFFGTTKLNLLFDEETGEMLIPMHQPIATMSSAYDNETYGYYFRILGVDVTDEGKLAVNEDIEYNLALFANLKEDAEGQLYLEEATNNIITDPTRNGYMGIFSQFDAEGAGYYMGYLHSISFTLNEGEYKAVGTGIKNVNKDEVKGNGKVYNLAGQQISANAKGIVVVNGKKVVK